MCRWFIFHVIQIIHFSCDSDKWFIYFHVILTWLIYSTSHMWLSHTYWLSYIWFIFHILTQDAFIFTWFWHYSFLTWFFFHMWFLHMIRLLCVWFFTCDSHVSCWLFTYDILSGFFFAEEDEDKEEEAHMKSMVFFSVLV